MAADRTTLLILGASGDLTSRLLLPGIATLLRAQPSRSLEIVGADLRDLGQDEWRERVRTAMTLAHGAGDDAELGASARQVVETTRYVAGDATDATALRALLSGDEVSVDGRYVHLDAVQLEGGRRTAPPILAGVRGPRSLALAGRVADGTVLAEPSAPEYIAQARQQIGAADHRVVAYNAAAVDADPEAARQAVRAGLEWIGEPGWEAHLRPLPFADEIVALRARSATRADFVAALPDAWVDSLTVSGTRDDARASLARMRAAGADCVVLQPVGDDPVQALVSLASIY